MGQLIHIKNMVCPRCVLAVQNILKDLKIPYSGIELGHVNLNSALSPTQKKELCTKLRSVGFELLETESSVLIAELKKLIIQQVYYKKNELTTNYSDYLAEKTKHGYNYLSRLFSESEGTTIEKYITKHKIEKIKELLFNNEKTLAEIAFEMDYSSSAYLSTQFKKETGMTPSEFKKSGNFNLKSIDNI